MKRAGWCIAFALLSVLALLIDWAKDAAEDRIKGKDKRKPKPPPDDDEPDDDEDEDPEPERARRARRRN